VRSASVTLATSVAFGWPTRGTLGRAAVVAKEAKVLWTASPPAPPSAGKGQG